MFRKLPLLRLCSLTALGLGAMVASAPSAMAACSCMCVDGTPYNVCTGFVSSQEQTPECDLLECPAVEEPALQPVSTSEPAPVEEPVAAIEPPHPGLECERRSVYRPDLGRYKKYKVCKPTAGEGHDRRTHEHAGKHRDAWATIETRRQARWEARHAQHETRRGHHRHDHDDEGDD